MVRPGRADGWTRTSSIADEFPRRVEIPTTVSAASLHFLGGVGGWAGIGRSARRRRARRTGDEGGGESPNGTTEAVRARRRDLRRHVDPGERAAQHRCRRLTREASSVLRLEPQKATVSKVVLEGFGSDVLPVAVAVARRRRCSSDEVAHAVGSGRRLRQAQRRARAEGGSRRRRPAPNPADEWHRRRRSASRSAAARATSATSATDSARSRPPASASTTWEIAVGRRRDRPGRRRHHQRQPAVLRYASSRAIFGFAAGKGLVMLHPGAWSRLPEDGSVGVREIVGMRAVTIASPRCW